MSATRSTTAEPTSERPAAQSTTHVSSHQDPGANRSRPAASGAIVGAAAIGQLVDARRAAEFLGMSRSLVYAYVERKQIPHYRLMGRSIRFCLAELERWRKQFHVEGGIE